MADRAKRLTLQQVATVAGVSAPTISKVLNGRPDVAADTRERVLQVLRDEQYLPRGASALPMNRTHIELVFDGIENPNNLDMMRGIITSAAADGSHVGVSLMPDDGNARQWVNELQRAGRAGVIMITPRLTAEQEGRLNEAELPVVVIEPLNLPPTPLSSVGATNWQGGLSAVGHLLDLGHRRIGMLRGPENLIDDARYHGYVAALSSRGIAVDPSLVVRAHFDFDRAVELTLGLMDRIDRPSAIFAFTDWTATGAIEAARQLGLRVPDDLSVVGFDDSVGASVSAPPLTTVRQPFVQMGETAYRVLADRVAGGVSATVVRIELATTLVIRASTAPPKV